MASVSVDGADQLRKILREMQDKGLKKELAAANKSAAQVVVDRALPDVPTRSGRLRRSVKALASQKDGRVKAGTPVRVNYAAAIHWGRLVGNVGSPPGNRMDFNPVNGRPFLYDAARKAEQAVIESYADGVDRLLEAVRRR